MEWNKEKSVAVATGGAKATQCGTPCLTKL